MPPAIEAKSPRHLSVAEPLEAGSPSETARHIARVAARLFAQQGFEATSVREIVDAAGVTKPTLYYYFGSKEGLAQALLVLPQEQLVKTMRRLVEDTADSARALELVLEALFAFCREDPDRARLMFAVFFGPMGAGLASVVQQCGCDINAIWQRAIERMVKDRLVAPGRAEACTLAVRGMHIISILEYLYKDRPLSRQLSSQIVRDLLGGFGRRPKQR